MILQKPTKKCKSCNKTYPKLYKYSKTQWVTSKYCSYKCHAKMKKEVALSKPKSKKVCRHCSVVFFNDKGLSISQWTKQKYCSTACSGNSQRIHADKKACYTAYSRRKGALPRDSVEFKEKLSRLTKEAMYRPEVQEKIRQPKGAMSLERRIIQSNKLKGIMPKNLGYDNSGYSNIKRGHYDINGTTIYFRSKWEANYALYLDFLIDQKEIYKWEFEPDTFIFEAIKLGTRSYTPDFKVFTNETDFVYHEVKGYMDSKSKTKLKRFAKYYPEHKLILIDGPQYNLLKKQIGSLCKFY